MQALQNARCMRAHGITNFPDPGPQDVKSNGNISLKGFPPSQVKSPQFQGAAKACLALIGKVGG